MLAKLAALPTGVQQYLIITGNYWAFTLTDGALRMLVVLYFHQLGYSPLSIAMLFLFYEFFGVVTNLVGGWLGARIGLNKTMQMGLALQVIALLMLTLPSEFLTVAWVMLAQAFSGIAKDLNKMSAKSSIKTLVPKNAEGALYKWVALLTGSKNTLKGVGFFIGGLLLTWLGFQFAILTMALALFVVVIASHFLLTQELGKAKNKPKFTDVFSKSAALNYLSAARMCLFAARDVWFVVAIPVFFVSQLDWAHHEVGSFMAIWVIGYGAVQALTPKYVKLTDHKVNKTAAALGGLLAFCIAALVLGLLSNLNIEKVLVFGLLAFGAIFAINSAVHSYIIVAIAKEDGVSMDVGFYYMANAVGRLIGTVFSGVIYQQYGIVACLVSSLVLATAGALLMLKVEITANDT
ncbi:organoarsenical effux MFS transporter ArsJ [Thalassotalea sp. M1531]|uniref:Organoarsenical effux MFS transporter ArsJ n=1 Tax=Thalassotalea algicola TaxID=2716224 RepID=A0A7Y0Q7J2_9GAMM|nr:organoarsenical effux MFS transporter ArsJ [Thalassotalea algicola]NMP32271.1 organoarsenical effux MFS transporter ArsJ [Thalassotalea algicola]